MVECPHCLSTVRSQVKFYLSLYIHFELHLGNSFSSPVGLAECKTLHQITNNLQTSEIIRAWVKVSSWTINSNMTLLANIHVSVSSYEEKDLLGTC